MSPSGSSTVAKATNRETREHNERLVLATIYDRSPISRAGVARLTGLTRTSVSDVVEGLLTSGMCREIGHGPSTGGKAPILLEVPGDARLLVGVDLGDQAFTAAIVNVRGSIQQRVDVPSENTDGDEALRLAVEVIDRVMGLAAGPVLGVGIGVPGLIDAGAGTIIQSVARDWRMLALGRILGEHLGLPVYLANDCHAAVLAEHVFGATRGPNLIMVKAGRGIGAGFVINGELFLGDGFGAGEIGHTVVDPRGRLCRCGRRGCLETVASVSAVLGDLSDRVGHPVSLGEALDRHQRSDPLALEVVRQAGQQLGSALGGLVGALHVRRFVLAGVMAAFGDPWMEAVATCGLRPGPRCTRCRYDVRAGRRRGRRRPRRVGPPDDPGTGADAPSVGLRAPAAAGTDARGRWNLACHLALARGLDAAPRRTLERDPDPMIHIQTNGAFGDDFAGRERG